MKKIHVTKDDLLICPRTQIFTNVKKCVLCEDCFGKDNFQVLCKRGLEKDEYLTKSGNLYSSRQSKKKAC